MEKKVLAVSGGRDSMLMLNLFADEDVIVAHFDHGTRENSILDKQFVENVCNELNVNFVSQRKELGADVSEEKARIERYSFLFQTRDKNTPAVLYTAHHLDDLVETIAINLLRGTGWRGLAVLDSPGIRRPFLETTLLPKGIGSPLDKNGITLYSAKNGLVFREDPTNSSDEYLRNRIRHRMNNFSRKAELFELWEKQKALKLEIDRLVQSLLPELDSPWCRDWFLTLDKSVALELLRAGTLRAGIKATRPQLENFRQAIISYPPGSYFNLPKDKLVKLTKAEFYL